MARPSKKNIEPVIEQVTEPMTEPNVIDDHNAFNDELLHLQANIHEEPYPKMEVSERFFKALAKGRDLTSLTYGDPGVRIFKTGTTDSVLEYEDVKAEKYYEQEIKKINEAANK